MRGSTAVAAAAVLIAMPTQAIEWQSPESIRTVAEDFVADSLHGQNGVSVEARGVDERIKLPACGSPLVAQAERPLRNGQGTVAVICGGNSPWKLFVPVRATHNVPVVVASRGLGRGTRLGPGDLTLEQRPSSSLPATYFTRIEDAMGLAVQRTIPPGAVLVPGTLNRPHLVQRGAVVTLVSGRAGIIVKFEGIALEDAALDQRVRIKTRSGRVVEGTVDGANQVRVGS